MSAVVSPDPAGKTGTKKKKKTKKKTNGNRADGAVIYELGVNGAKNDEGDEDGEDLDDEDGHQSPANIALPVYNRVQKEDSLHMPSLPPETSEQIGTDLKQNGILPLPDEQGQGESQSMHGHTENAADPVAIADTETAARLDAMQHERDSLRVEVTQLRLSLESLQEKHNCEDDLAALRDELEQTQQGKEQAETQYRNLLGKVNTIRSQLGDRLKADAEELEQARARIEELEAAHTVAQDEKGRLQETVSDLNTRSETQAAEVESLRNRANLSTNNWAKERDDMIAREALVREEYEVAKQAMQDWEILATEERSRREGLEDRAQELEEQLNGQQEVYSRLQGEAETQNGTVDQLQRALRDLQEERKRELRELVEQSQTQLDSLRTQADGAEATAAELRQQLTATQTERDRFAPFEREVREKNLLIGKLRHEAVILNDHLTKALRFLRRGRPEDTVDRRLVTNHLLHFLALDRTDAKKFQVLQLIASLLSWTEEQKEQAGLLRQGSMMGGVGVGGTLKLPSRPFRRTPSTPSLTSDFIPESPVGTATTGKESLAELWSEFLEREAAEESGPADLRRPSSVGTSVTMGEAESQSGKGGS